MKSTKVEEKHRKKMYSDCEEMNKLMNWKKRSRKISEWPLQMRAAVFR